VRATRIAKGAARISVACLGIAVLTALAVNSPAEAKKKKAAEPEATIVDVDSGDPMIVVVSTGQQKIDIYRGTKLVTTSAVSTGTASYPTMIGAFSILEKKRYHHSNLYSNAPMPWMNRITWSGTALHAGIVPGYPASHGCIRLLYSFAPKFFQLSTVGDNVIVSRGRPAPAPFSHPFLFQPTPLSKVAEQALPTRAGGAPMPSLAAAASPVILAKAEIPATVATDGTDSANAGSEETKPAGATHAHPEIAADPNRTHAITTDFGAPARTESAEVPSTGSIGDTEKTAAANAPSPAAAPATEAVSLAAAKIDAGAGAAVTQAAASEALAKLEAGILAASIQAAEPRSEVPLRMLFTRRTQRDRVIDVQKTLSAMDYLPEQNFDGTIGSATIKAIKAFQADNGMAETGTFDEELVKKIYAKAGKSEPPAGHLFVRQAFTRVFDTPVDFRDPDQPLGTHVYTAMKFGPKDTTATWVTVNVQDDDGGHALDRLKIPDDVRQKISERLTPGSTLIVADTAINTANLSKGNDFVVLAKATSSYKISDAVDEAPKVRTKRRKTYSTRSYSYERRRAERRPFFFQGGPWGGRGW
jgi:peptidoglycan hydrolase-like protein with peptidoglycan-binding domain